MKDINVVTLSGRLANIAYNENGDKAATTFLSVACNKGKAKSGEDLGADFITVVVYGNSATACHNYLSKGSFINVQGHLNVYQKEVDGKRTNITQVVGDYIQFVPTGTGKTNDKDKKEATNDATPTQNTPNNNTTNDNTKPAPKAQEASQQPVNANDNADDFDEFDNW